MERLDTIAFTVYFVVPALMFLEVSSEITRLSMGVPTYGKFFALISLAVFIVSQLNLFVAIRIYRNKMTVWRTLVHSFQVSTYVYAHWVPVIFISFCQIIFGKGASTWHPTEHAGTAHSAFSDAT